MSHRARVVAAVTLTAALAACEDASRPRYDAATIRLATGTVSSTAPEAASLADRDTTTGTSLSAPMTVDVEFDHDVEVRAVKLFLAGSVEVSGAGVAAGTLSGSDAWVRLPLEEGVQGRRFSLTLTPSGGAARVGELELWGAGLPRAPRDLGTLARVSALAGARFENALVVRGTIAAATLHPVGVQGDSCVRTRFAAFPARAVRRAHLVYEADVQRPVVLSRSLNAAAPVGGFWIASGAETRTVSDELDPERLTGDDEVQLCAPGDASAAVSVAGLRLVLLLDDGTEHWDRETRRLLGAAADGDDATSTSFGAGRHDLGLERAVAVDEDEARVSEAAQPRGQVGALERTGWTELGEVTWGAPGSLGLAGRTIQGAHVDFAGDGGARVAEVRLTGSGVGRRVGAPRIVLSYPETRLVDGREVGERFGAKAFVAGWAESPSGPGVVEVGGARVGDGGAFATEIERPITSSGSWAAVVRARFPDGTELTRTIEFEDDRESEVAPAQASSSLSDAARFGRENEVGAGTLDPELGGKVKLGTDVELEAPPGAVSGKTAIAITRKGSEVMPPLDAGMVNVTAPAHFAYRFLPKGQRFAKAVKVKIPYDPTLLPEGTAPEEIQTWYYDDGAARWQPLPRVEVSRELQRVTSETTHFTFMINAVLVLPDHPGPVSFNPNSIKDLKAADPSANVDFIEAPQANSQGTAQLSFPIRLPKARGAYQPSLRLSYDSAAGNGWAGVGWSLPVSSVAIDTKYGVPFYDGLERYVLDGAQLVPGAVADGSCVDGGDGRLYHARIEREYRRIVRCGTGVGDYRFEVTDRSGVLYLYGTTSQKRLQRPGGAAAIAEWYLDRVIDLNGNLTVYGYDFDSATIPTLDADDHADAVSHGEPFTQAYLRSITYSGRAPRTGAGALTEVDETVAPAYRVELRSERRGRSHLLRPDVVSSARSGFKVLTRRRLGTISVTLVDGAGTHGIREYVLAYEEGDYGKSRLAKISVRGAWEPGAPAPLFYEHALGYYDAPDESQGPLATPRAFGAPEPLAFSDGGDDQALSRSEGWGYGIHGYVGIGPIAPSSVSVGVRAGFNQSRSTNVSSILDVNGDWLPDRLRLEASGAAVRFNDGALFSPVAPASDPYDGRRISSLPISTLGHSSSTSFNLALQAKAYVFSASFGKSWFSSDTPDFLVDVDGDGLVDVLDRGRVVFNQERTGNPQPDCTLPANSPSTFCFAPTKWVRQIGAAAVEPDLTADLSDDPEIAAAADEIEDGLRPADTLVEWLAPWSGPVEISGSLHLSRAGAAQLDPSWDGVRLSIYKVTVTWDGDGVATYFKEPVGEPIAIALGDVNVPTPVHVPFVEMSAGGRLYFVLSTLESFPVAKPGPFPIEEVSFAPTISYLHAPTVGGFELRDPTNAPLYRFDAFADFRLAGAPLSAVTVPADGTLEVSSFIVKKPCADDVRVCVQKFGPEEEVRDVSCRSHDDAVVKLWGTELPSSDDGRIPVDLTAAVKAGEKLVFRVETDLSVDPAAVDWSIAGKMTTVCVEDDAGCVTTPADQEDEYSFVADAYVPLHLPVDTALDRTKLVSARPRTSPEVAWIATEPGVLTVSNGRDLLDPVAETPGLLFAIRTHRGLVDKGTLRELQDEVTVRVEPGDHVFFEAHAEVPFGHLGNWVEEPCAPDADPTAVCSGYHQAWTPVATFTPDLQTGLTPTRTVAVTINETVDHLAREDRSLGIESPFGGGFHGWRYGVWGGPNAEEIEPELFAPSASGSGFTPDAPEETAVEEGLTLMDPVDSPDRRRAERVQPLVPRRNGSYFGKTRPGLVPRVPAYVSRDGNVFVTPGTMHAAREGGYVEGGEEAGSGEAVAARFRMGKMSRLSVGESIQGGLSALFAGVSIGAGSSRSKADVRDMNGDGIVDVLSSSGSGAIDVTLTDARLLSRRTSFGLGEGGGIQDNKDVSVSFNLGISDAVRSFVGESSTVGSLVAMFPGVGGGLGVNYSATTGELVDVNGDGLPDAVRRVAGELGFRVRLNLGTSFAAEDFVPSGRFGAAVDDLIGKLGSKIASGGGRSAALLGVLRGGTFRTVSDPNMVRRTTALSINDNLGKGIGERVQATVSWESSVAATAVALMDVNGDGLPDYVRKGPKDAQLKVMLNTGYGFAAERAWNMTAWPAHVAKPWIKSKAWVPTMKSLLDWVAGPNPTIDSIEANGSYSERPTIGFVYTYSFPIWVIRLHFSVGADVSPKKLAGLDLSLQDVNGDGLPDHVLKAERLKGKDNRAVYVRLNELKKGNLLRSVTRPLGGSVEVDYTRTSPSVEMAGSRWVMTRVVQRDGRAETAGEPGHELATTYAYAGGRHDRAERDFLGFATVERVQADGTRVVQSYDVSGFAKKGLLLTEETRGADGKLFVVVEHRYPERPAYRLASTEQDCTLRTPFFLSAVDYCQSFDVQLESTTRTHLEGTEVVFTPGTGVRSTQKFLEYDDYGNVKRFHDAGDDSDPDDDLWATVTYATGDTAFANYSVSRPKSVEVTGRGGTLLRQRSATYDASGNVDTFTANHADGVGDETDLDWYDDGTLKTFKAPPVQGRRYTIDYEYDPVARTYPVRITDAHGYSSTATYDLRFGEVATTTDLAGQVTSRRYDENGRLQKLFGPRSTETPLVEVSFQPLVGAQATPGMAWARTANRLPAGGSIDTVVVADGLKRVIQTKKTADVSSASQDGTVRLGWSVSGHQRFDPMGRVKEQGLTFFEEDETRTKTGFAPGVPLRPTTTTYDPLGRPLTVTSPAEPDFTSKTPRSAVTRTTYDLAAPRSGGGLRLRTTVTDANGHVRAAYRALADRIVAVEERQRDPDAAGDHLTSYVYNPVGELTAIRDAEGHRTTITYDLLGRRRLIESLDAGTTELVYDAMGNMVRKQDSKLRDLAGSPWVRYEYDLDRLVGIRYPEGSATMDVKFEYGPPGVRDDNGAGRIVRVVDDAGEETRAYGPLGELVRTTRTLRPLKPLEAPMVFTTRFEFDEFGRMNWIRYPDGETVCYEYDRGGLLKSARGDRPATFHYPAASEQYLQLMTYDEFGQRSVVKLGNGAVTKYGYYPENHRLASLHTVAAGRTLQNLAYGYDLVGNVTFETNGLGPATDSRSGDVSYEFLYDSLDRLRWAKGTAAARPGVTDEFETRYAYSPIHNMRSNQQIHKVTTVTELGAEVAFPPHTNHDFTYAYDPAAPHRATQIGDMFLTYDENGNTTSECRDHGDPTCSVNRDHYRSYQWTEDNRLASVVDGGGRSVTRFIYDAGGERIVKYGRGGASITIGQFFNVKGRTAATKHVFAGTARLASKLLPPGDFSSPTLGAPLATTIVPTSTATTGTGATATNPVGDGSPNEFGCDPSDYQPQKCPILVNGEPVVPYPFQDTKVRPATYYHHPDHLGSTSWVTDQNGKVHEHVEYFPYGAVWRDPASDRDGAGVKGQRFLFSGKELDEETGLYYFGARYLAPARARWLSADPEVLKDAVPGGRRGEMKSRAGSVGRWPVALSAYAVSNWGPVTWVDPDGRSAIWKAIRVVGQGARMLFRVNRNTGKELAKKGVDMAVDGGKKDATRLAKDVSKEVGGKGKAVVHEGHPLKEGGTGSPHAHPLGPDGKPYKAPDSDGPHIFFDTVKKGGGILMFIFDSNVDGQIDYRDAGEWLNPLPFDMPATHMDYEPSFGGRSNDWA